MIMIVVIIIIVMIIIISNFFDIPKILILMTNH